MLKGVGNSLFSRVNNMMESQGDAWGNYDKEYEEEYK